MSAPRSATPFFVICTAALALPTVASANSTGKTGLSTRGCTSCHGTSADTNVTAAFSAPVTEAAPGDVVTITFTVTTVDSSQTAAGMNVSASGGTLAAGTNTQLSSSEITHASRTTMSSSVATFTFDWTAPSTEDTYSFYGVGNAVNANGSSGTGDGWDLATDITIEVIDPCNDADGDGYTDCDGDCDEDDATINPGATELCDGIDQNCDDLIDNGVSYYDWFPDGDGDGYGDSSGTAVYDCISPEGDYAPNGDDCDDDDDLISPDASETCDGIDEDCDGVIDNGAGTTPWFPDADGDGYGDADAEPEVECTAPDDSYVENDDDCDDGNPDVAPGATEIWYDGIDQDCRGDDDYDRDRDGHQTAELGGTDCDDNDPEVWEDCGDGDDGGDGGGSDDGADEGTGTGDDGTSDGTDDGGDGTGDDGGTPDGSEGGDDTGSTDSGEEKTGCSTLTAAPAGLMALWALIPALRRRERSDA